jgi:hypothetical protein
MSTSRRPGRGTGISRNARTSGPPYPVATQARMIRGKASGSSVTVIPQGGLRRKLIVADISLTV